MSEIFVSYTSRDRDWAFWIGQELERLGHRARIHEWEIPGGGDIPAWMENAHQKADNILCVISAAYLNAPYSNWERRAAQWAAQSDKPSFALPVIIEPCEVPHLLAHVKHCNLAGLNEEDARSQLESFLAPATPPERPTRYPGRAHTISKPTLPVAFPETVPQSHSEEPRKQLPQRPPKPGPITVVDDPQKRRWGGRAQKDGRKLTAVLLRKSKTLFWINLLVESVDGSPLEPPIIFHLHDSYRSSVQRIRKIHNGRWAVFEEINCSGAYTVGVQVKDRSGAWIGLEYDLRRLKGLPARFR